jgi:hypothetical protein
MTTEKKNAISDLTQAQCAAIIEYAYKKNPKLHKVKQRAFRAIVGEVGHRDREQKSREGKPVGHWCDSTLEQLSTACDYSVATVRDVLAVATIAGVVRLEKRGGKGTASKRTIDLTQMQILLNELCAEFPHLCNEDWRGIWRNKRGIVPDSRGADSAPLTVIQDIYKESRNTKPRNQSAFGNALQSQPLECEICDGTGFVSTGENRAESRARRCVCRNS